MAGSICIDGRPISCRAREYPDRPWVGVGVVVWRGDEILLVRRAKPPRVGEWSIPGGAQSLGETVFEAAIREVREETGIAIRPTGIITVVDSILRDEQNGRNSTIPWLKSPPNGRRETRSPPTMSTMSAG